MKHYLAIAFVLLCSTLAIAAESQLKVEKSDTGVAVTVDGKPFATYVFHDQDISRPYFAHVFAATGQQVTRNHPPQADDAQDHATFHPGIWLAFGDLSGQDYWRLKATVVHDGFVEQPRGSAGRGHFTVRNRYLATDSADTICTETCRYDILVRPMGTLLIWDSRFTASHGDIHFGDQEEMGLGLRVATPLTVTHGGEILDSEGRRNGDQVWGHQADWCDYSGVIGGDRVGMTLMPDPTNFRRSWYHARDYGFVAANPFGVKAFTRGEASKVTVKAGETLRLRFAVLVHSCPPGTSTDLSAAYRDFLTELPPREPN